MANRQHIAAHDLHAEGIVHQVVAEPPDAARDIGGFTRTIAAACAHQLRELGTSDRH